jgi:hypothetical protein
MSIQSDSVFTLDSEEGNLNRLANLDESPKPYSGIVDFYEVEPDELKARLLFVPKTAYHVVAELENGQDHCLSFDVRLLRERDEHNNLCEWVELDNLHLDGVPARHGDVDSLFEDGLERLEAWVLHEEQAIREDQVFNRDWEVCE